LGARKYELVQRESGLWVILSRTGSKASVVETGHLDRNLAALDLASYASSRTLSPIGRGWLKVADRLARNIRQGRHATSAPTSEIVTRTDVLGLLLDQGYRCAISGSYFTHDSFDGGAISPYQPSVDRRDPGQGYNLDNVRIVCLLVNLAMSTWGEEPLLEVARRLVAQRETPQETPE
jgi:hypothetical protein